MTANTLGTGWHFQLHFLGPKIHGREWSLYGTNITANAMSQNCCLRGFPGGSGVKNPPANLGDMDSIPDPERSHMLWSNEACALEPRSHNYWSLCALESVLCNKRSLSTTTREEPPLAPTRVMPTQQWRAITAINKQIKLYIYMCVYIYIYIYIF